MRTSTKQRKETKMATKLTVEFAKTRTAEKIVEDLKFALEWDGAEYYLSKGQPCVRYWFTDEDGKTIQRTRTLLDLDAICEECSDGTCADDASFTERFDYVFYVWGKDENGNWVMGYED